MEKYDNVKIGREQAKELLDIYNALILLKCNNYLTGCEFSQKIERYAYECSGKIAIALKNKSVS